MTRKAEYVLAALFAVALLFAAPRAQAQVLYGSIVGNVIDPSGAPVPGATVTIKQRETGETRTSTTSETGGYVFPTIPSGTYDVTLTKTGFRTFIAEAVSVTVDQVARVDAQLQVGSVSESVQVSARSEAVLQTDSAQVLSEIGKESLENVPTPANRNYENLLVTVPGISPPDNAHSAIANPSRGLQFNANGATRQSNNIRIDGASSSNVWLAEVAGYVPGLEAIESVSVVTSTYDQTQGLAAGAAINVFMKSGTNQPHGSLFEYNITSATNTRPYFQPAGQGQPKYISNDFGGTFGGPIVKNKLFYFLSYDGNFMRQNAGSYVTIATAAQRSGDMSASTTAVYDPATGNPDGSGRTVFPGNIIPAARISSIAQKLDAIVPLPNIPGGLLTNNYYATGDFSTDRDTTDAKVDWHATDKLTISPRFGWARVGVDDPSAFGNNGPPVYTASSSRAGHGWGNVFSTTLSATYIARPNLIIDSHYAVTVMVTNNEQPGMDQNLGRDVLGIPGTNGPSRAYGGYPEFSISSYAVIGSPGSKGGPIYYDDRQYQYTLNGTWVKNSHSVRFGFELGHMNVNHFETPSNSAAGYFAFSAGTTTLNAKGASGGNQFNSYASFLLGLASSAEGFLLPFDNTREVMMMRTYRFFVQDLWQATRKLTVSTGLGWNYFPMGHRSSRGLERYNYDTNQVEICGVAGNPSDCGYDISKRSFSPSLGLAFRPTGSFVIRAGYSLNYDPEPFAYNRDQYNNYPELMNLTLSAPSSWLPATTLAQGLPSIAAPDVSRGVVTLPNGYTVSSLPQHPKRDYFQSWNVTLQKQFGWGFVGNAGYVGTRGVDIPQELNLNVAQVGGGTASELFNQRFGTTAEIDLMTPVNHTHYDALQSTLSRRFAQGVLLRLGYTFSKNTGICCDEQADGNPNIQLPQYMNLNRSLEPMDRTHNFNALASAELPFGRGKRWLNGGGIASSITGGWQTNALFVRYSGTPFSVSGSSTSLNATGNTQRADQIKPSVAILGGHGPGESYFDPLAFANVTDARFGTAGFDTLRGPGTTNLDFSLFRSFKLTERFALQFRAEAFNLTNTPAFANPGASVNNLSLNPDGSIKSLGSYTIISSTTGTGREGMGQRQVRFGLRISF